MAENNILFDTKIEEYKCMIFFEEGILKISIGDKTWNYEEFIHENYPRLNVLEDMFFINNYYDNLCKIITEIKNIENCKEWNKLSKNDCRECKFLYLKYSDINFIPINFIPMCTRYDHYAGKRCGEEIKNFPLGCGEFKEGFYKVRNYINYHNEIRQIKRNLMETKC